MDSALDFYLLGESVPQVRVSARTLALRQFFHLCERTGLKWVISLKMSESSSMHQADLIDVEKRSAEKKIEKLHSKVVLHTSLYHPVV